MTQLWQEPHQECKFTPASSRTNQVDGTIGGTVHCMVVLSCFFVYLHIHIFYGFQKLHRSMAQENWRFDLADEDTYCRIVIISSCRSWKKWCLLPANSALAEIEAQLEAGAACRDAHTWDTTNLRREYEMKCEANYRINSRT